jgi:hypothetical protein
MLSRFRRRTPAADLPRSAHMRRDIGLPLLAPPALLFRLFQLNDRRR